MEKRRKKGGNDEYKGKDRIVYVGRCMLGADERFPLQIDRQNDVVLVLDEQKKEKKRKKDQRVGWHFQVKRKIRKKRKKSN